MRLGRRFYTRDSIAVARALLGQTLVRLVDDQRLAGVIVETEAYLGAIDKAAHTFNGRRTARNASMWLGGGHAYVYFTYGMHYCMNVVAGKAEEPVAVLLRAIEPTEGLDFMRQRRKAAKRNADLCSGPAKLCQALGIDRQNDGTDLVASESLFIEKRRGPAIAPADIVASPRVGVAYAEEWAAKPLRFYIANNLHVSKH